MVVLVVVVVAVGGVLVVVVPWYCCCRVMMMMMMKKIHTIASVRFLLSSLRCDDAIHCSFSSCLWIVHYYRMTMIGTNPVITVNHRKAVRILPLMVVVVVPVSACTFVVVFLLLLWHGLLCSLVFGIQSQVGTLRDSQRLCATSNGNEWWCLIKTVARWFEWWCLLLLLFVFFVWWWLFLL